MQHAEEHGQHVDRQRRAASADADRSTTELSKSLRRKRRLEAAAGTPELAARTDHMIDVAESVAQDFGLKPPTVTSRYRSGRAHGDPKFGAVDIVFEDLAGRPLGQDFDALADALAGSIASRLDCNHEVLVERVEPRPPLEHKLRQLCSFRNGHAPDCSLSCRDGQKDMDNHCEHSTPASSGWTTGPHLHIEHDGKCHR